MDIKTVIFDFGGVLYRTPSLDSFNRWKKLLGFEDNPHLTALISDPNESEYLKDVFLGKVSEQEMWERMIEQMRVKPQWVAYFRKRFASKRRLNQPMVNLLRELHQKYQTAILSNAGDQTRALIEDVLGLDNWVEQVIISAEEGLIKPDRQIYALAMDRLGAAPETTLFIDDLLPNVTAARAFGMQAVQFTQNDPVLEAVGQILGQES